jgi:hypothetical protein
MRQIVIAFGFVATMAAQTLVVGTGNPDVDITAVQAAVDRGGSVVLKGHFSFERPPSMHGMLDNLMATILVSKEVTISGTWDDRGDMATIQGGEIPFAVEAPGKPIRIERLRFVRSQGYAILVAAVGGLSIESCTIAGVEPLAHSDDRAGIGYATGIYVASLLGLPNRDRPGHPENIFGRLSIVNNEIVVGGTPADNGMGIMLTSAGTAARPVDVDISGNTIRNATKKGINIKEIGGQARIERNVVTSTLVYTGHALNALIAGIHCGGAGSYFVAHNRIDYADPDAAGIRVRGFPGTGAIIEHATVVDNDVTMSVAEGKAFGMASAGIEVRGQARDNVIERNTIRGRARIALSVSPDHMGIPAGTSFRQNEAGHLVSPLAEGGIAK